MYEYTDLVQTCDDCGDDCPEYVLTPHWVWYGGRLVGLCPTCDAQWEMCQDSDNSV